jgi:predicted membrane channel-forming protein YqfA (hemolysin III family)
MARADPVWAVVLTTLVSHLSVLPAMRSFVRRRWLFELFVSGFCFMTSFFYHLSECLDTPIFLTPLQWHRLDNIGALAVFGNLFTYLSDVHIPLHLTGVADSTIIVRQCMQYGALFLAILVQEKDPWNEWYTFVPVVLYALFPFVTHLLYGRMPRYKWPVFAGGIGSLLLGVLFFVWGLDDANDPCRVYHGMWHMMAGIGMYHLWRVLPRSRGAAYSHKTHV